MRELSVESGFTQRARRRERELKLDGLTIRRFCESDLFLSAYITNNTKLHNFSSLLSQSFPSSILSSILSPSLFFSKFFPFLASRSRLKTIQLPFVFLPSFCTPSLRLSQLLFFRGFKNFSKNFFTTHVFGDSKEQLQQHRVLGKERREWIGQLMLKGMNERGKNIERRREEKTVDLYLNDTV